MSALPDREPFSAILASSVVSVIAADAQGKVVELSRGAERLFGHSREQLLGRSVECLVAPEQREAHRQALATARPRTGSRVDLEPSAAPPGRYLAIHRDGSVFPIELSLHGAFMAGEARWLLVSRSAEEPGRLRSDRSDQLVSAQRLELLGTLASGVAHDLNNLLTPILAAGDLLSQAELSPEHSQDLDAVRYAADQGRHLVRQLLYFARQHGTEAVSVSTPEAAEEVADMLRRTLPPRVTLEIVAPDDLPPAMVDRVQFEQVLLNLTGNAIHAVMGAGGVVRVVLDACSTLDSEPPVEQALHDDRAYVRVRVMDSGPGIAEALASRIFQPFFTTKPAGVGTGLGLSVCQGIAQRHGGVLRLEEGELPGACFALYLPVATPEARVTPSSSRPPAPLLSLHRVLAVDDDPAILRALTRLLGRLDLEVHSFTEPLEALAYFELDPQRYDAVLTDGLMPAMSGLEFADEIRARRQDIPVLLVSGLGDTLQADGRVDAMLAKPFRLVELRESLAEAIMRRSMALRA